MKYLLFFTFCNVLFNLLGQNGYKWINHPTVSGILDEFEEKERDYRLLHGKVQEMEVLFYNSTSIDATSKLTATYSENGAILSILHVGLGSKKPKKDYFFSIQFVYDENNKIERELITKFVDGKKIKNSKTDRFFSDFPEPITKDQYGNSLRITADKDTTYSFYDEQGRKIMDSIPLSSETLGKKDNYRYFTDSVYCEKIWSADSDVPSTRENYLLDVCGNWVEKKIFWDNDLKWMYMVKRKFVYYD